MLECTLPNLVTLLNLSDSEVAVRPLHSE